MIMFQDVVSPIIIIQVYGIHELLLQARIHIVHTLNMNVADVSMLCFNDNAHEMMVHMLMSCSYDAHMQGKHLGCYSDHAEMCYFAPTALFVLGLLIEVELGLGLVAEHP
jgi:hypothetical protein